MANVIGADELGQDQAQNQNQGQNQPGQPNAAQAGQAPSNPSQAPAITSSQVSNPNQQKGSGYTNIQSVLKANQGNQLGQAVGSNIQQVGSQAQQNLQNAQNNFQQQTQQNAANNNANNQLVQNVLANPTQYATNLNPNSQQGKQFQTLISGQYQGPTSLQNANQIQAQAGNLAQMGQALGSSGGRQALLQQMFGNPQYTSGQATLDNLLLGQSQSPALQAAKRQALTEQGQVNSVVQGAAAQGQQAAKQAQAYGQGVQGQFANTVTTQNQAIQDAATAAQAAKNAQYQQTLQDLQSGKISQDEANLLGLTQGENVYNLFNGQGTGSTGAAAFLTENPIQANASNVANAQQYAQMQALQNLGGQYLQGNQAVNQALSNYQNPSQAGTFASSPVADANLAGPSGFNAALAGAQSNYNSIYQPAQQQLQQAQQITDILNKYAGQGLPGQQQAFSEIAQFAPGALGSTDYGKVSQWAAGNLQSAQQNMQQQQNILNQQFGTPETIQIGPTNYPTLGGLRPQQTPNQLSDLENMPQINS